MRDRHAASGHGSIEITDRTVNLLSEAALDTTPISGWTHNYYRYPARFSPRFAAAAIELFSQRGDLIVDPYMGGGTAIVEALVGGRRALGNDLNELATFVARVKTTPLRRREVAAIRDWVDGDVPLFGYRNPVADFSASIDPIKTFNLSLPRARFIKKASSIALVSIESLPTKNAREFARCALLRVAQKALDGRKTHTPLTDFRKQMVRTTSEMLVSMERLSDRLKKDGWQRTLTNKDAADLKNVRLFANERAALVVTSPPYPGVHVLYHRWQVDGRRETPAPYWITGCNDGRGASFYNFGDRRQAAADRYFDTSLTTLRGIREIMRKGAYMVQLLAFNNPDEQLSRYLENMAVARFCEVPEFAERRIWRTVPNRKWHANLRGQTSSAQEVVLVHRAV